MKKLATLLCAVAVAVVAVASLASAQATTPAKKSTAAASAKPAAATAAKTHMVDAEVVSTDAAAKTITIKGDPNKTVAVDASAVASLKGLKAGDKVKVTCRDNEKGEHQAITKIAMATK